MDIAALSERITIQKNTPTVDAVGNHLDGWSNYFSCYATVGGEESSVSGETQVAGQTVEDGKTSFTVRWCEETAAITATEYRVVFRGELYDINGINHQSYKKKSLKLMCQKCRR